LRSYRCLQIEVLIFRLLL